MSQGSIEGEWYEFRDGWRRKTDAVIGEAMVTIYVNGVELATVMCTPLQQDLLGLGMLKNEGLIETLGEVEHVHLGGQGCCVDIWLTHGIHMPQRRIITSGCGSGVTFADPEEALEPLQDEISIDPGELAALFNQLHVPDGLHARAGGVHTAGLAEDGKLLCVIEDVGRHNTIDKLAGACMLRKIDTRGRILLSTGRISSEMLRKGVRMGCPIIASRSSATSMSVEMAEAAGVTLVGYVRRGTMRAYTHARRLGYSPA